MGSFYMLLIVRGIDDQSNVECQGDSSNEFLAGV